VMIRELSHVLTVHKHFLYSALVWVFAVIPSPQSPHFSMKYLINKNLKINGCIGWSMTTIRIISILGGIPGNHVIVVKTSVPF